MEYDFTSTRGTCPLCGHNDCRADILRIIDTNQDVTGKGYFKCHSCGGGNYPHDSKEIALIPISEPKKPVLSDSERSKVLEQIYNESQFNRDKSDFAFWFKKITNNSDKANEFLELFHIGADKQKNTTFWYKDIDGNKTHCKVLPYSPITGNRLKDEDSPLLIKENKVAALSGYCTSTEPLYYKFLSTKAGFNNIGIFNFDRLQMQDYEAIILVESEKSAFLASYVMPKYCFVTAGGTNAMDKKRFEIIKKFANVPIIVLYDNDTAGIDASTKIAQLYNILDYTQYFQFFANPKIKGFDIGDFAIECIKNDRSDDLIEKISKYIENTSKPNVEPKNDGKLLTKKLITQAKLEKYIKENYILRNNTIKNRYEFFQDGKWQNVTDIFYNTLKSELYSNGIEGNVADIKQYIQSSNTKFYDAFQDYINELPPYKFNDVKPINYIQKIADLVEIESNGNIFNEDLDTWYNYFTHWFVGIYAQAMLRDCSQFILIFVGNGGIGKGQFAKKILPSVLYEYIAEFNFNKADEKDSKLSMCQNIILDADELEYMNKSEQSAIKSIIGKNNFWLRAPYGSTYQTYYRRCSFIGSSNPDKILADETGSRRFLIVRAVSINYNAINDELLNNAFAQAKYMYDIGYNIHFTQEEIKKIDDYNEQFRNCSLPEELIKIHFAPCKDFSDGLTSSQIFIRLLELNSQMREWHNAKIGIILKKLGYEKKTVRVGNGTQTRYNIKELKNIYEYAVN